MHSKTILLILLAITLLTACGGGSEFVPNPGPFAGQFVVDGAALGNFTFTVNAGALGGTGTLVHNEQTVTVAISANVNGDSFSGTLQNANLGNGTFVGSFKDDNQASGTYAYADAGGISTQTGTWEATIQ